MTGTFHEKIVDTHINILNKTFMAGQKALTTVNEQLSRKTFVPISNKLTKIAHDMAKAHGPHPEVDVTIASVKRDAWSKLLAASNVTTETIIVGGAGFPQHSKPVSTAAHNSTSQQPPAKRRVNKKGPTANTTAEPEHPVGKKGHKKHTNGTIAEGTPTSVQVTVLVLVTYVLCNPVWGISLCLCASGGAPLCAYYVLVTHCVPASLTTNV
jgi:hypothetical protein